MILFFWFESLQKAHFLKLIHGKMFSYVTTVPENNKTTEIIYLNKGERTAPTLIFLNHRLVQHNILAKTFALFRYELIIFS
jgi:hypothetical protein